MKGLDPQKEEKKKLHEENCQLSAYWPQEVYCQNCLIFLDRRKKVKEEKVEVLHIPPEMFQHFENICYRIVFNKRTAQLPDLFPTRLSNCASRPEPWQIDTRELSGSSNHQTI